MTESLALANAHIITMGGRDIARGTLVIEDGKIAKILEGEGSLNLGLSSSQVIDLSGKTILPGFVDSHTHLVLTGFSIESVNLSNARSIGDVLELIRGEVSQVESGEWVFGTQLVHRLLREKRNPTIEEIDRVSPENPVWLISNTCHSSVVNTLGFQHVGLSVNSPGVEKDPATGRFTGAYVTDQSHFEAHRCIFSSLSIERIQRMIEQACNSAVRRGVTTLHALDGSPEGDRIFRILLETMPRMPLRIVPYFQTMDVNQVLDMGLPRIGGCLALDGAWLEHTVALTEPYEDFPDCRGMLFYTDDQVESFVQKAHESGLQISMHAIGDAAIEQILRAYEKALARSPRMDHRHRIEHFSLPSDDQIMRARDLGIVAAMQPMFSYNIGGPDGAYVQYLGEDRANRIEDFRALLDRGMKVCGGSDSPVTPIDPLMGIHAAVNNPFVHHRVSVEEAVQMFTGSGASAAFEEEFKGTVEVGHLADLVVLHDNPKAVNSDRLGTIRVAMTLVGGKVVWQSDSFTG